MQSRPLTAQEQADLPPTFTATEYVYGVVSQRIYAAGLLPSKPRRIEPHLKWVLAGAQRKGGGAAKSR